MTQSINWKRLLWIIPLLFPSLVSAYCILNLVTEQHTYQIQNNDNQISIRKEYREIEKRGNHEMR